MNKRDHSNILNIGKETLKQEAKALLKMSESLDKDFIRAVEILNDTQARIIITGIGKSGHVARKIAATLASTGTPAQFVHAAEAAHGDLGMITKNDTIIAISKSGKTPELAKVISYATLKNIPIIAITANGDSSLANSANVTLLLADEQEACSMGLAPTTSTTMTIALGDAIATALLQHKGFSPNQFHDLHPGGNLGNILMRASDVMHEDADMPIERLTTKMRDAIIGMSQKRFGCIGIIDGNSEFVGIITDGDLRRNMDENFLNKTCEEVMTCEPYIVGSDTLISVILKTMNEKQVATTFVVEDKKPIGIIHIHDILKARIDA